MDIRTLTETLSVSPQIRLDDMTAIAGKGYKSVISNRPDGEEPDQPTADAVRAAAEAEGLVFRHIPVSGGNITDAAAADFASALATLPKPILGFCRTGTRTTSLALPSACRQKRRPHRS